MANGADFTSAEAYKAYVERIKEELYVKLFYGAPTLSMFTPHEGVKGRVVLTDLIINKLARRYNNAFRGFENTDYEPFILEVTTQSVEHSIFPKDFESSYLGHMRKTKQSSDDYPFEAFTLNAMTESLTTEIGEAIWQAVKTDTPTADDYMDVTFDGILKQIEDFITATTLVPVVTGAITPANVLGAVRAVYTELDAVYKVKGVEIFLSVDIYDMWRIAYKKENSVDAAYAKIDNSDYTGTVYELGNGKTRLVPVAEMGTSQRIIAAPMELIHYGFDGDEEFKTWEVEKDHRRMDFWTDFNLGVALGMVKQGIWVVNDQV